MLSEMFRKHIKPTKFLMYSTMKTEVFHIPHLFTLIVKQLGYVALSFSMCIVTCSNIMAEDDPATVLIRQADSRSKLLRYMKVEAEMSITVNETTNGANCLMQMAGRDSLAMEISGPFGISVARLFSNSQFFLFHDILQGRAIQGKPTRETLSDVTFLPLSFDDYASLFRAEPPGNISMFSHVKSFTDSVKLLFKRTIDPTATEYLLCNKLDGTIKEYQRKNKEGIVELSMVYDQYSTINGISMPTIVSLNSPLRGVSVTITAQNISVNEPIPPIMRFPLPNSITPLRMD